ncbi:neurocan core protein-like [Actinia tenebrosa]|uniref:Neurocan core protein-like n=1 Tax=Actinia tenebrosa TaxID=6105 RepID=A0A6P8HJ57_ACTTE|nr:neurocan core protein-like [Actinia tenebrosa]
MKLFLLNPITVLLWLVHYSTSNILDDVKNGKEFEEIKFHILPVSVDKYANKEGLKRDANYIHYSIKNPCEEGPCPNFTVCTVQGNTQNYNCLCKRGFTGEKCEIEIDYCKSSPCLHGASCVTDLDHDRFVCICVDGYLGNVCQKRYHKDRMSAYDAARTICQGLGSDLPTINSAEENELVRLLVLKVGWMWIGLHDPTNSNNANNFKWINGIPVNYTNWHENVNNEVGGCGYMDGDGLWHIHNCAWGNGVGCFLNW